MKGIILKSAWNTGKQVPFTDLRLCVQSSVRIHDPYEMGKDI